MTEVTRFPHYHQAENVVTNHVMVMLRTLYDASPKLLEGLLQALCSSEVTIGPRFTQQIAGARSIPDGLIAQEPLAVFIETKLGSDIDASQLQRHCATIRERLQGRANSFLIALTAGREPASVPDQVKAFGIEYHIQVASITFAQLVEQIDVLPITNLALRETVDEFTDFIYVRNLIPRDEIVAVLTGTTWQDNAQHGVYFEPAGRRAKWMRATFMGLYHERNISHVGRICTVVVASEDKPGVLNFQKPETGTLTGVHKDAVAASIKASQDYYPNFQTAPHRYYIVDRFTPIDLRKRTAGGMMGHRYLDFEKVTKQRVPTNATSEDAAKILDGHSYV